MSDTTKPFTPPVPLPDELKQPARNIEHFEVRVPSPLEVASMHDYPAAVMRAVALAANEAGMSGKRLDGFAMVENGGMSPRIVFQVSSEAHVAQQEREWSAGFDWTYGGGTGGDEGIGTEEIVDRHVAELLAHPRSAIKNPRKQWRHAAGPWQDAEQLEAAPIG